MKHALLFVLLSTHALAADRVALVREKRLEDVKALAKQAGLGWPVEQVYLRAFKKERVLELWASKKGAPMVLVKSYPFCAASGELGPKRQEGDLQVPEGFYEVSEFNAASSYHLALKVSYPNASDRVRSDARHPGGLIYLHGKCVSIGCIAIEDAPIEEVYLFALEAKLKGIPFHLFPMRLSQEAVTAAALSPYAAFWAELAPGYQQFERTRRPPRVKVDGKTGAYSLLP